MKLDGKVAVITGAASGIGEATAEALAVEGAAVILADLNGEELDNIVRRIEGRGSKALAVVCDVTQEVEAHNLIRRAKEEFGRVDILVNSAGVLQPSEISKGYSKHWRLMFEVNVFGLLYTTHAAIEAMKDQSAGHLVNISSIAGRRARVAGGVYSGTKYAIIAISEALRQELLKDNIRVTVIEPGTVETGILGKIIDEETRERMYDRASEIDPLQPEDIAAMITYAVTQPARVSINEVLIRPAQEVN